MCKKHFNLRGGAGISKVVGPLQIKDDSGMCTGESRRRVVRPRARAVTPPLNLIDKSYSMRGVV